MLEFLSILFLIFGILQIILFFKIWGMTNDVAKLAEKFCGDGENGEIKLYGKVKRISDGKLLMVTKIEDGKYTCIYDDTHKTAGSYALSEIAREK